MEKSVQYSAPAKQAPCKSPFSSGNNTSCVGLEPRFTTTQLACEELSGTAGVTQPQCTNSVYTQYCDVIDSATVPDHEQSQYSEDNFEMQEELMQSAFHKEQERYV